MDYKVQSREPEHQMNNIFHHSLIKIIFLHHLNHLNISWGTLIENYVFIYPPSQLARSIPPPVSMPKKEIRSSSMAALKETKKEN